MLRTVAVALLALAATVAAGEDDPVLWPDHERQFLLDGPGVLLDEEERAALLAMAADERRRWIEDFLSRDPIPETPENELTEGIRRRRALVQADYLSFRDDRARMLFLRGAPAEKKIVECGETFHPIEIWTYGAEGELPQLVFYQPKPGSPYRLWFPVESKRALYSEGMQSILDQLAELKIRVPGKRIDVRACPDTPLVDAATGIIGLRGFRDDRPTFERLRKLAAPPEDLAAWSRLAARTPLGEDPPELAVDELAVLFPDRQQQRIVTRFLLTLPDAGLVPFVDGDRSELRLNLEGVVEQEGRFFEDFKVRFKLPPPAEGERLALVFERAFRPGRSFLVRMRLRDEIGGAQTILGRGLRVPAEPEEIEEPPVPEGAIVAMGEQLASERLAGRDSLLLVPPESDLVLGLFRADVLVTGERIVRVVFLVDGEEQLTRTRPPFTAEVRLAEFPIEQLVRVEGYDAQGNLIASDEVLVNQPRGSFRVRIVEPAKGADPVGRVRARAEVVVPEERRVREVEFRLNEETVRSLHEPPWLADIELPGGTEVTYLTVVATLDDGARAEDVRYINAPRYLEEVEVDLVELLVTVLDRSRQPVPDLTGDEFEVFEDGRPQQVTRFELVRDLPLSVGITLDTSGSMATSLPEAKAAAAGFLRNVITPRDKAFAVGFAGSPVLLIAPTDDVSAVESSFEDLQSLGWTALHDAVVSSLYYFRGMRGRRALILLSDGDDSASHYAFRDALEYARRSGVVIYAVGLDVSATKVAVRRKLNQLAQETGGRSFFIHQASELEGIYREIEEELRSQYLLAYASDAASNERSFRTVEVKLKQSGLKARTISGYYP